MTMIKGDDWKKNVWKIVSLIATNREIHLARKKIFLFLI